MKLHKNERLFRQAVLATSEMMNIQEIYIEKDYWVTLALKTVFESNVSVPLFLQQICADHDII